MTFERIKLVLAIAFFVALLVFTQRAQKDVLEQKDPKVLNFMAAGYCPNVQKGDGTEPLIALDVLVRGEEDTKVLFPEQRYLRGDAGAILKNYWEKLAAERHQAGEPGYHQAWKVRFLEIPDLGAARKSWAFTRLMGRMAPEFMYSMATPRFHQDAPHWFVDLTPHLLAPNPYVPGNERWIDLFYPTAIENWRAADGRYYAIPIDQVEIGVFYNRDMFRACGIGDDELPPRDWAHFLDIQRRIKQAGEHPFLMTAATRMRLEWTFSILCDMIYDEIWPEINQIDSRFIDRAYLQSPEVIRAIRKGIIEIGDDRWWEPWRIIKEWSQYWYPGAGGLRETLHFRQGHAAMTLDGSWLVKTLEQDKGRDFEYGVFFLPKLTKKTSQFASDAMPRGVGGATAIQYSITKASAQRKDAVAACVDLLQYISAPKNLAAIVREGGGTLPAVRVPPEEMPPGLGFMDDVLDRGGVRMKTIEAIDTRSEDEWWAQMQALLGNRADRESIAQAMQRAFDRAAEEMLEEKGNEWQWIHDKQGRNTWDFIPGPTEKYVNPPANGERTAPQ